MGFRAFLVMDNKVARQTMAENGGKWQIMVEKSSPRLFGRKWIFARFASRPPRWPGRQWQKMAENGGKWISAGKWWKMDFRAFPVILLLLEFLVNKSIPQTREVAILINPTLSVK